MFRFTECRESCFTVDHEIYFFLSHRGFLTLGGLAGTAYGFYFSAAILLGAGIGSPTGKPADSYFEESVLRIGIPAAMFLIGLVWLILQSLVLLCHKSSVR